MGTRVKIQAPVNLPPTGLSPVTLKAWKAQLTVYLKQSETYRRFLTNGVYEAWTAADVNEDRILALHEDDTYADDVVGFANLNVARLTERRIELETFLSIIANLCDTSDYEDIMMYSTSLDWVIKHIEQVNDIQKKGVHFLKLYQITFNKTSGETYTAFYKRFRGHFQDNLRKQGDIVKWKVEEALQMMSRLFF